MIRTAAVALGIALALTVAARADDYLERRQLYLASVWGAYLAVGCKVVTGEPQILPFLLSQRRYWLSRGPIYDPELEQMIRRNAEAGLAASRDRGGCEYFTQHPDRVRALRDAAEAAYQDVINGLR